MTEQQSSINVRAPILRIALLLPTKFSHPTDDRMKSDIHRQIPTAIRRRRALSHDHRWARPSLARGFAYVNNLPAVERDCAAHETGLFLPLE